ncbi:MAG: two pore domain potassium channel family protein [Bdellovibrionales bacterium]|nr:two pore domain potassium channel family protein [Bdellovibrionales bacterium]
MLRHILDRHRLMLRYSTALLRSLRRPIFTYLIILVSSLMSGASGVFYWLEFGHNPHVQSFLDALYFVVSTMTGVGGASYAPETPLGKIFAMALMLLGTAVFVTFTAVLATALIELDLDIEAKSER